MAIAKGTQRTYLKERLQRINGHKGTYSYNPSAMSELPKPRAVVEAEADIKRLQKIAHRFEVRERKHRQKTIARMRAMAEECSRAIEFEDSKTALALLDRFERMKF